MSAEHIAKGAHQKLETVMEDSKEALDEGGSKKSCFISPGRRNSMTEIPIEELIPCSGSGEDNEELRSISRAEDELEGKIEFSLSDIDPDSSSGNQEDRPNNFDSSRQSRSMSYTRISINSEKLESTWEARASDNILSISNNYRNKSLINKKEAFNYCMEELDDSVEDLENSILSKAKNSLESLKSSGPKEKNALGQSNYRGSSLDWKANLESSFANSVETETKDENSKLSKPVICATCEQKDTDLCILKVMNDDLVAKNSSLTNQCHDLQEIITQLLEDTEKLKSFIQDNFSSKSTQTDLVNENDFVQQLQREIREYQSQNRILTTKEGSYLCDIQNLKQEIACLEEKGKQNLSEFQQKFYICKTAAQKQIKSLQEQNQKQEEIIAKMVKDRQDSISKGRNLVQSFKNIKHKAAKKKFKSSGSSKPTPKFYKSAINFDVQYINTSKKELEAPKEVKLQTPGIINGSKISPEKAIFSNLLQGQTHSCDESKTGAPRGAPACLNPHVCSETKFSTIEDMSINPDEIEDIKPTAAKYSSIIREIRYEQEQGDLSQEYSPPYRRTSSRKREQHLYGRSRDTGSLMDDYHIHNHNTNFQVNLKEKLLTIADKDKGLNDKSSIDIPHSQSSVSKEDTRTFPDKVGQNKNTNLKKSDKIEDYTTQKTKNRKNKAEKGRAKARSQKPMTKPHKALDKKEAKNQQDNSALARLKNIRKTVLLQKVLPRSSKRGSKVGSSDKNPDQSSQYHDSDNLRANKARERPLRSSKFSTVDHKFKNSEQQNLKKTYHTISNPIFSKISTSIPVRSNSLKFRYPKNDQSLIVH
ncbi:unnamed protein product [Moneuplotes crassus]|uniref:Uncharacterized protein n=1 Tax=Euplotes crassus TaxID=5936 RepID=A0AAD1Y3Y2_EUPCR|nr:unnamed protein product [Moneuplotes crassus]